MFKMTIEQIRSIDTDTLIQALRSCLTQEELELLGSERKDEEQEKQTARRKRNDQQDSEDSEEDDVYQTPKRLKTRMVYSSSEDEEASSSGDEEDLSNSDRKRRRSCRISPRDIPGSEKSLRSSALKELRTRRQKKGLMEAKKLPLSSPSSQDVDHDKGEEGEDEDLDFRRLSTSEESEDSDQSFIDDAEEFPEDWDRVLKKIQRRPDSPEEMFPEYHPESSSNEEDKEEEEGEEQEEEPEANKENDLYEPLMKKLRKMGSRPELADRDLIREFVLYQTDTDHEVSGKCLCGKNKLK